MHGASCIRAFVHSSERLLQLLERAARRDHAVGVHDLARRQPRALNQGDAWNITNRARQLFVDDGVDEDSLAPYAEALEHLRGGLGLDFGGRQLVDDDQRAVFHLLRERRPQSAPFGALRDLEVVASRLRPEHRAAVAPQGRADRAHPRASGPLLPPGFLATAADERTVFRRVGPAPLGRIAWTTDAQMR